jgi:glycosyltransferase involved in cell wall biosynthesis
MSETTLPFVSFIIPTKNEETNLEICLHSIIALDYPKERYELIVADGHSEDRTCEIAHRLGAKVINNDRIIQSAARNIGAMNAAGDLIAFIDADIILDPEWLKKAVAHFNDPEVAAVGNFPGIADDADWIEKVWFFHIKSKHSGKGVSQVDWLASANIIFDKEAFTKIGGFDESIRYAEDVDIGFRATVGGYRIILDPGLKSTHLDYENSLTGFAKRQLAGGRVILQLLRKSGFKKNWRIAFFISFYLLFIITFILGIFFSMKLSAVSLICMVLMAALLAFQRCHNAGSYVYFLPLSFLLLLSGIFRAVALVVPSKR